jgi:2-hydroxy-4-carboxymuconate semialdehyde hemiacetal dehydrogenase
MDLTVAMKSRRTGAIATIAHSFNNHGEIRTPMRFIGEEQTFEFIGGVLTENDGNEVARGTGHEAVVRQNREFFTAIREQREPETSFARSLTSMRYLDDVQQVIEAGTP